MNDAPAMSDAPAMPQEQADDAEDRFMERVIFEAGRTAIRQQKSTTEIERKTTAQPGTIHCLRGRSGGALTIKTAEKDGEGG